MTYRVTMFPDGKPPEEANSLGEWQSLKHGRVGVPEKSWMSAPRFENFFLGINFNYWKIGNPDRSMKGPVGVTNGILERLLDLKITIIDWQVDRILRLPIRQLEVSCAICCYPGRVGSRAASAFRGGPIPDPFYRIVQCLKGHLKARWTLCC